MKFLLLFMISVKSFAFTLNTNIDAHFKSNDVKIWITQNSSCSNIGFSNSQILDMAIKGAQKFWNRVPSSNLNLIKGGVLATTDSKFITGQLCVNDSDTFCDETISVPSVNDIVIACNTNDSENFTSENIFALSIPSKVSDGFIKGSIILLNDTASTKLRDFSKDELINILAHELGHAIGIGHSFDSSALMYSYYKTNRNRLGEDDIDALTYLYPNKLGGCAAIVGSIDYNNFLINFLGGFLLIMILNSLLMAWRYNRSARHSVI